MGVEAALEGCWQSGGSDYLFSLMLALGLGGLALLLSPLRFKQPGPNQRAVPWVLVWLVRVFALAIVGWTLVDLGLRGGPGAADLRLRVRRGVGGSAGRGAARGGWRAVHAPVAGDARERGGVAGCRAAGGGDWGAGAAASARPSLRVSARRTAPGYGW